MIDKDGGLWRRRGYKLFRLLKGPIVTPLFFERHRRLPLGVWHEYTSGLSKKGYATRPGWHIALTPELPHLARQLANGEQRVLAEVSYDDVMGMEVRPVAQGGTWVCARWLRIDALDVCDQNL